MEQAAHTLRKPFAKALAGFAMRSKSAAFERILDGAMRVDPYLFDDIWHDTLACLFENIQKENFVFKGNLLGYLTTIATRRIADRDRKSRRFVNLAERVDAIEAGFPSSLNILINEEGRSWLLKETKRFYDQLNENDQQALLIGMRIATDDENGRVRSKVFAEKVRLAGVWTGSDAAIARRYVRLRKKLCEHLVKRECDE
jgi:DNA-directed RNA polymerase specialized sigma24 family protein